MRKIRDIISTYLQSGLFWVLLLGFTFRNIYQSANPGFHYNSDTLTYCYTALHIFDGAVDAFRTPVYPIVIRFFQIFNNDPFPGIVVFQHIVSFISIIPFYLVCKQWFRNKYVVFIAATVYACMPYIIFYNNAFYPESLLISSLVFFLYLFSRYIVQPTISKSILINIYVFYLVMLKPGCVIFYGVLGLVWLLKLVYKKDFKFIKHAFIGFGTSILLLFGYCLLNKKQNNHFGISTVSHDNNFANVVLSEAYKEFPDKKLVSIIDTIKDKGHYYTIYYLNNDCQKYHKSADAFPPIYSLSWDMDGVLRVPANEFGYTREKLAPYVKEAMLSEPYISYILDNFTGFTGTKVFFLRGYMVYLLFFIEALFILYLMVYQKKIPWTRLFVFIATAGILFTVLAAGIDDGTRSRVLMPVAPFLIFMLFDVVDVLILLIFNRNILKI